MKAVIISGDKSVVARIDLFLKNDLRRWKSDNLIMVDINSLNDQSKINSVQDNVENNENIVILFGACDEKSVINRNYHIPGLLSYGNVGYINSCNLGELPGIYNKLKSKEKMTDKFGLRLYKFKDNGRIISRLRQTIDYVQADPVKLNQWLITAKRAGLSGPNEKIFAQVRGTDGASERVFEGIFVEAQGTLFDRCWNLRPSVYDGVLLLSKKEKKPTVVIYDGSSEIRQRLAGHKLKWSCVSKNILGGIKLDLVIDDMNEADLASNYDISAKKIMTIEELAALN